MKPIYFYFTLFLIGSAAHAGDCWLFKNLDKGSQLRSLKIKMGPSQDTKSPDPEYIAKIEAKDLKGISIGGQMGCSKESPTRWQCNRPDDGGSFDLALEKENVVFSTSYLMIGPDGDYLKLQSDPSDPWVFEGSKCR